MTGKEVFRMSIVSCLAASNVRCFGGLKVLANFVEEQQKAVFQKHLKYM